MKKTELEVGNQPKWRKFEEQVHDTHIFAMANGVVNSRTR